MDNKNNNDNKKNNSNKKIKRKHNMNACKTCKLAHKKCEDDNEIICKRCERRGILCSKFNNDSIRKLYSIKENYELLQMEFKLLKQELKQLKNQS
jgi:hypothetical protein